MPPSLLAAASGCSAGFWRAPCLQPTNSSGGAFGRKLNWVSLAALALELDLITHHLTGIGPSAILRGDLEGNVISANLAFGDGIIALAAADRSGHTLASNLKGDGYLAHLARTAG